MKKILILLSFIFFTSLASAANLSGYTKHETVSDVTLYYKATDYAVHFAVKNNRNEAVTVTIKNVTATWSDGKRRTQTVRISHVSPGSISKGSYDHADNYSTIKGGWSSSEWSWKPF